MISSVRQWLAGLGLERFAEAFEREEVTLDSLPELSEGDLKDLGLPLGPRKTVLRAATGLGAGQNRPAFASDIGGYDPDKAAPASSEAPAERRQLTVMFCDMVGSTSLSQKLDPEALRELMRAYQQACGAVIEKYHGHVAQYLGDGLMVYFGWPRAHEDDAERAIRAGLEVLQAVKAVTAPEPLRVRIGIATGPVVVGETGTGDASVPKVAVGETPNLAARLQSLAGADEIVIAPITHRLVGGVFEVVDLGERTLKGIVEPVRARRVAGIHPSEGRFEAARGEVALTPLVGREEEVALLLRRWQQAKAGEGQVVLLGGEPGVGKSRITHALREAIGRDPHRRLRYQCSPFHTQSALYPVIEQFERAAAFRKEDGAEDKLDKVEALLHLASDDGEVASIAPLFAELLSLPAGRHPPLNYSPEKHKERTLEALVNQVAGLAKRQPILMVFEDVHWVDPTTQEVLDLLVSRMARFPILLMITYRPGYSPNWAGEPHVTALTLNRLNRRLGAQLVAQVAGGKPLPSEVLDQIVEKTDGVPLFVEELTKHVLESGLLHQDGDRLAVIGPLPPSAIPSSLHDSLMARLDRLASTKQVAQIGACIGREFSHELIAAVSPLAEPALSHALEQIVASQLVFRHGVAPEATYTFKHALVQEAAYESILRSRRQQLHARIAQALHTQFAALAESSPELPAIHFERAGLADEAVTWYVRAGTRARGHSANQEAVVHFQRALGLLDRISAQDTRQSLELELQANLGALYTALEGWTSSRAQVYFNRAHELGAMAGREDHWMLASCAAVEHTCWTGDVSEARKLGEKLVHLAVARGSRVQEMRARNSYGLALMYSGHFREALEQYQRVCERYDQSTDCESAFRYGGIDFGVNALGMTAYLQWEMGYADRGTALADESIELARSVGHSFTLAFALAFPGADLSHYMRDPQRALRFAREGRDVARKAGYVYLEQTCAFHEGSCEVGLGRVEEGMRLMLGALEQMKQLGALKRRTPGLIAHLADALRGCGRADEGLELLAASPDRAPGSTRSRFAEVYRTEGDLHVDKSRPDLPAAERCYRQAIAIATGDGSRMRQLRASTRLAQLWRTQGKADEAYSLLRPLYDSFSEGFGTPDLIDARTVLEELRVALGASAATTARGSG